MDRKLFHLIDEATNHHAAPLHAASQTDDDVPELSVPWELSFSTLKAGLSAGVDVLKVRLGEVEFQILPTRGMGLWKGNVAGFPVEWKSPVTRPVHPSFVNLHDRGGLGWLHGFNELLCRCGLGFNGPPGNDAGQVVTLHGRIANLPAHSLRVEVSAAERTISVMGIVDELSMFGDCYRLQTTYTFRAGFSGIEIHDLITNLSGHDVPLSLLYHLNIGKPFLAPGAQLHVPFHTMAPRDATAAAGVSTWPTYLGPTARYAEEAYFFDPIADECGQSLALLVPPVDSVGEVQTGAAHDPLALAVRFDRSSLPWFTVWKNTCDEATGYVTGLEPAVNLPNFRGFERSQGRLPAIAPSGSYDTHFSLEVLTQQQDIDTAIARIRGLQEQSPGVIHPAPKPGWSPNIIENTALEN
ncbi:MAG: hypothetical protein C0478_02910 [Planctomyces sp.]|nr:hypothetical protein [Planctomyces sp.]